MYSGTSMYIDSTVTFGAFYCDYVPMNLGTTSYLLLPVHLSSHLIEERASLFSLAHCVGLSSGVFHLVK